MGNDQAETRYHFINTYFLSVLIFISSKLKQQHALSWAYRIYYICYVSKKEI
ncbi:hypothetical protein SRABI04_00146 [Chryseobacterium sp. Bi04]|nr:hypothetical protein SRABI04_00146 [Chryseobacterium sp. Bi04]